MKQALTATDATIDQQINGTESQALAMVDFWAPWCGPCRFMSPVIDQLAETQGDAMTVTKLNIDENPETAQRFNVRSIPTLILFREGREIARHVGAMPAPQVHQWLLTHSAEAISER